MVAGGDTCVRKWSLVELVEDDHYVRSMNACWIFAGTCGSRLLFIVWTHV